MRPDGREETTGAGSPRERLRHVYWIGGGSGAGKSTIARRIAALHDLRIYSTDEVMPDHAGRITPQEAPCLSRFKAMSMDERWLDRSPETMLQTFHWFRGEGFGLIVEDLLRFPAGTGVIAEGLKTADAPRLPCSRAAAWGESGYSQPRSSATRRASIRLRVPVLVVAPDR